MPALDKTGPKGQGSLTGRGMGPCGGNSGYGRRGNGMGRGARRNQPAAADLETEKQALEQELADLKREMKEIKSKE